MNSFIQFLWQTVWARLSFLFRVGFLIGFFCEQSVHNQFPNRRFPWTSRFLVVQSSSQCVQRRDWIRFNQDDAVFNQDQDVCTALIRFRVQPRPHRRWCPIPRSFKTAFGQDEAVFNQDQNVSTDMVFIIPCSTQTKRCCFQTTREREREKKQTAWD